MTPILFVEKNSMSNASDRLIKKGILSRDVYTIHVNRRERISVVLDEVAPKETG